MNLVPEPALRSISSKVKAKNIRSTLNENLENSEHYKNKAKKYHNKCYIKIQNVLAKGETCPAGYENYLQPFRD